MRQAFLPLLIILTGCASIPIGLKIAGLRNHRDELPQHR